MNPPPTIESLSAALASALAPETQVRAGDLAGLIRTDGAAVAAALLVEAIGGVTPRDASGTLTG